MLQIFMFILYSYSSSSCAKRWIMGVPSGIIYGIPPKSRSLVDLFLVLFLTEVERLTSMSDTRGLLKSLREDSFAIFIALVSICPFVLWVMSWENLVAFKVCLIDVRLIFSASSSSALWYFSSLALVIMSASLVTALQNCIEVGSLSSLSLKRCLY